MTTTAAAAAAAAADFQQAGKETKQDEDHRDGEDLPRPKKKKSKRKASAKKKKTTLNEKDAADDSEAQAEGRADSGEVHDTLTNSRKRKTGKKRNSSKKLALETAKGNEIFGENTDAEAPSVPEENDKASGSPKPKSKKKKRKSSKTLEAATEPKEITEVDPEHERGRSASPRRTSSKRISKKKSNATEAAGAAAAVPVENGEEYQPYSSTKHNTSKKKRSKSASKRKSKSVTVREESSTEVLDPSLSASDDLANNLPPRKWYDYNVPPSEDALHLNSFLQRESKRLARCPCTYFWTALVISVILSFIALVVGEFEVSAETGGWQSRGTLIADRQQQTMMATAFNEYLFYGGVEAWDDLTQNVQPGWESLDEFSDDDTADSDARRRLLWKAMAPSSGLAVEGFTGTASLQQTQRKHLPFTMTKALKRRLQEAAANSTATGGLAGQLAGCDISFYDIPVTAEDSRLWPVWSVKGPSASALDASVVRDLCVAEQNTQTYLEENGLCYGCDNGKCLPPYSLVFYARLVTENGFQLDCDALAADWEPKQAAVKESWKNCVETIKATYDPNEEELPENCPFGFYPSLVDGDFDETMLSSVTSTIFATHEAAVDELYENLDAYDRGTATIEGAYETQYEDFSGIYLDSMLGRDMSLALGSAFVVAIAIIVHTRSPLITGVGLLQIILSFPLSFFVYKLVAGLDFFPFLNFIGIFVVFALGAGDIFVAIDKWKNARISFPSHTYSTEFIAAKALPDAAYAMLLTTLTTAVAFFATAICPVAPIKMFAIFCGLLIMFDYIMNILLVFPALCIYDKAMIARELNANTTKSCPRSCWACCVTCNCFGKCGPGQHQIDDLEDPYVDDHGVTASKFIRTQSREFELTQQDEEEAKAHASFIQRIMLQFYVYLHKLRWPLFLLSLIALSLCVWKATTLELPTSSDVRLLSSSHEFEKSFVWRQELLSSELDKLSGSTAYTIWGVTPADTGNQNNPASWTQLVLDDAFDVSSLEAQSYMRSFCDYLFEQEFASMVDDGYVCPFVAFDDWLAEQAASATPDEGYVTHCESASSVPVPQASFNVCMSHWAASVDETTVLSRDGIIQVIFIPFNSRVRYDSFFDVLDDEWNLIESWFAAENAKAPQGVNQGYFTSFDFWWYDTNGQMLSTAYSAAAIALGASAAVILISSRSIVLTLFSTVTIGFVLTSVTSILVAIGWTLGFLESICFAILIGVSVDFVIHLAHAYSHKPGEISREDRTKYALVKMGPSILATAVTTILSAVVMLFTVITFFQKFALILFVTVIMASLGSFIFLLTILVCVGPTNPTRLIDKCMGFCYKQTKLETALESNISKKRKSDVV